MPPRPSSLTIPTEPAFGNLGGRIKRPSPLDLGSALQPGRERSNDTSALSSSRSRRSSKPKVLPALADTPPLNRPSPKRTSVVLLAKAKTAHRILCEEPSPVKAAPKPKPKAKDRWKLLTLERLQEAKAAVEGAYKAAETQLVQTNEQEEEAATAVVRARRASVDMQEHVQFMLEDFRLMQHQPAWRAALEPLLPWSLAPAGGLRGGGRWQQLAEQVLRALEAGEPEHPAHRAALLLKGDAARGPPGTLTVACSTPAAVAQHQRLKPHAVWAASHKSPLVHDALAVMASGTPLLRSPHGTADAASVLPLRDAGGRTYGVLLSAAPALPDAFVHAVSRAAGPALERAWKRDRADKVLTSCCEWLERLARGKGLQLSASWSRASGSDEQPTPPTSAALLGGGLGGTTTPRGQQSQWKPLPELATAEGGPGGPGGPGGGRVNGLRGVKAEVRWSARLGGGKLGTLGLSLAPPKMRSNAAGMGAALLQAQQKQAEAADVAGMALLHATAPLLRGAVEAIEQGEVGAAVPAGFGTAAQFEATLAAARPTLPATLEQQLSAQLRSVDAYQLVAELKAYANPSAEWVQVVAGVLALLGRSPREDRSFKDWEETRRQLTTRLVQNDMRQLKPSDTAPPTTAAATAAAAQAEALMAAAVPTKRAVTAPGDSRRAAPPATAPGRVRRSARDGVTLPPVKRAASAGSRKRGTRLPSGKRAVGATKGGAAAQAKPPKPPEPWRESARATAGLSLEATLIAGELPWTVRTLVLWLATARLVRELALSVDAEAAAEREREEEREAAKARAAAEAEAAAAEAAAAEAVALAALERPPEVAPESKAGVASAESSDAAARPCLTMSPNDTHMAGSQQQQQQQQSAVVRKFASSFSDVNLS